MNNLQSGHLQINGYKIYHEIYGTKNDSKLPLLVLHGGPGSAHNYLLGLAQLAQYGRQIIFYDQLGCGESEKPKDDFIWTMNIFQAEIPSVRKELGLNRIHLLGHSWGGMLAIDYLLSKPNGIASATLASSMISLPLFQEEVDRLKKELPGNTYAVMRDHESSGTTVSAEYQMAYSLYKNRHLFRGEKFPLSYSSDPKKDGTAAYNKLWGPSEAYADGELKDWDRIEQLKEIRTPVLITAGQYDELTPWQAGVASNNIPNAELAIFTNGSHLTHIEREADYLDRLEEFLDKHDGAK